MEVGNQTHAPSALSTTALTFSTAWEAWRTPVSIQRNFPQNWSKAFQVHSQKLAYPNRWKVQLRHTARVLLILIITILFIFYPAVFCFSQLWT